MRTEAKILQHNRLDANSSVSLKLWKQAKSCADIFEGSSKNLGREIFLETGGNWKYVMF